eukprot:XP_001689932.1 predicted protein [Chlamydomonas reinhardtii]
MSTSWTARASRRSGLESSVTRRRSDLRSLPPELLQSILALVADGAPGALAILRGVDTQWMALASELATSLRVPPTAAPFDLAARLPHVSSLAIVSDERQPACASELAALLAQLAGLPALRHLTATDLPAEAAQALSGVVALSRLTCLDISRSDLPSGELPAPLLQLPALQVLRAAECGLGPRLAASDDCLLGLARSLRSLDVSGNKLLALPPSLSALSALTCLNAAGNKLQAGGEALPGLEALAALAELDISGNQGLELLPPGLFAASGLTRLDAADCDLAALDGEQLARLSGLQQLSLSGNWRLGACPAEVYELRSLTQLDLSGCGLSGLPESLGAATQLQQLALSSNDLQQLPACLARLTRLRNLAIDYNSLCSLPVWLSCLTQLTSLDAAGNELTDLPPQMAPALGGLRLLTLGSNALQTLPACVMQLSGLQELDLSCNQLSNFPVALFGTSQQHPPCAAGAAAAMSSLPRLDFLSIAGNRLSSLPAGLAARLPRLTWLDVSDNRLTALPAALAALTGLQVVTFDSSSISAQPPAKAFPRKLHAAAVVGSRR